MRCRQSICSFNPKNATSKVAKCYQPKEQVCSSLMPSFHPLHKVFGCNNASWVNLLQMMLREWITNRLRDYKTIGNKMDNKWTATQNDYSDYWAQQKTRANVDRYVGRCSLAWVLLYLHINLYRKLTWSICFNSKTQKCHLCRQQMQDCKTPVLINMHECCSFALNISAKLE